MVFSVAFKRTLRVTEVRKFRIRTPPDSIAGDKAGRYVCSRQRYWGKRAVNGCSCKTTTINAGKMHDVFWPKLKELITGPDLVDKVYAATQRILRGEKNRKADDRNLAQQISEVGITDRHLVQPSRRYGIRDGTRSRVAANPAVDGGEETPGSGEAAEGSGTQKVTRITREQIEKYLKSLSSLLSNYGGEEAKHYIQSLVTHHGLQVRMTGPEQLSISLAIKSPGTINTETVTVKLSPR